MILWLFGSGCSASICCWSCFFCFCFFLAVAGCKQNCDCTGDNGRTFHFIAVLILTFKVLKFKHTKRAWPVSQALKKKNGLPLSCGAKVSARHVVGSSAGHSPRGDGGALVALLNTPDGSLFFQDTSGHWTGILADLRPDVAIVSAAGRGNIDGQPIQGSLAARRG